MFSVYGINGRVFSGSLEGLRELAPVAAVARLRAIVPVRPAAEQLDTTPGALLAGPVPDSGFGTLASLGNAEPRQREALAAYAQLAQQMPAEAGAPAQSLVERLMSRRLVTVPIAASVAEGQAMLAEARVGQAPVVDADGHPVGLLSRADLLPSAEHLADADMWRAWLALPVVAVMWTPLPAVTTDTPLAEVAQVLIDLGLPGLPVLGADGAIEGFLSRGDLLRGFAREPNLDLWS